MRYFDINPYGVGVTFPDLVTFAFLPNVVEVSGAAAVAQSFNVNLLKNGGEVLYSVNVPAVGASTKVDISHLIQCAFGDMRAAWDATQRGKTFGLSVTAPEGRTYMLPIALKCMWGALEPLGRVGQFGTFHFEEDTKQFQRHVRFFKNYPFSVETITGAAQGYQISIDGTPFGATTPATNNAILSVDGAELLTAYDKAVILVQPNDQNNVWDATFDYTFDNIIEGAQQLLHVAIDDRKCGYYLRWVDTQGLLQYYLFAEGTDSVTTKDEGQLVQGIEQGGRTFTDGARVYGKERTATKKICATLVPVWEQQMVQSIGSAVLCDLYMGKDEAGRDMWLPVVPKAGTLSVRENKGLQDIEVEISTPCAETQTL